MKIQFSPPDISQIEIDEVVETLKSGWITTGPKTKKFEKLLAEYMGTEKVVCLNSATIGLEFVLRYLGVGPGDEVISCAYTYTSSASVINHVGAKTVMADCRPDEPLIDYEDLERKITERTKVIIPTHLGGKMVDTKRIIEIAEKKKHLFKPENEIQKGFGRIIVLGDAAHSLGAEYNGLRCGQDSDFSCYSFHAVKNFTTAEGGAVTWNHPSLNSAKVYEEMMLLALHGQSKDALAKTQLGQWEYDIIYTGYKGNMTDINACLGLGQLKRYPELLKRREEIVNYYDSRIVEVPYLRSYKHRDKIYRSSFHLFMIFMEGKDEKFRNEIITEMGKKGIATNVHYKPLPMMTAYKNLGLNIADYPNSYNLYKSEITLPLHTKLTNDEAKYIMDNFIEILKEKEK